MYTPVDFASAVLEMLLSVQFFNSQFICISSLVISQFMELALNCVFTHFHRCWFMKLVGNVVQISRVSLFNNFWKSRRTSCEILGPSRSRSILNRANFLITFVHFLNVDRFNWSHFDTSPTLNPWSINETIFPFVSTVSSVCAFPIFVHCSIGESRRQF